MVEKQQQDLVIGNCLLSFITEMSVHQNTVDFTVDQTTFLSRSERRV
jgi:hypothetical protein